MNPDWRARTLLPGMVRDFRRCGGRLVLADLYIKAIYVAVFAPLIAVLLRWSLLTAGSGGVATDQGILLFFLSPVGIATLFGIGSFLAAIYFDELGAVLAISMGARLGTRVWPRGALRFTSPKFWALLRLSFRALLRIVLISAPFLAVAGIAFALLLTEFDIYFYVTVRPPEFWIAATVIGASLAVGAFFVIRRMLRWSLAIPILVFEDVGPRRALVASAERTTGRLRALAVWHGAWWLAGAALSAVLAGIVGLTARGLVRPEAPLAVIALGIVVAGGITLVLYVATLVFSTTVYTVMLGRLYETVRPDAAPSEPYERLRSLHDVRWNPAWERLGGTLGVGAAVGLTILTVMIVNRARIDPNAAVTAHRGAKYEAPENTMPAFERAIALGADWLETDVHLTADDEVIVIHDSDLNRVAGSSLRVGEATLSELRELDVGAWFGPEFAGLTPPTLDELLEAAKGRVRVNLELKYSGPDRGLAQRVIDIVERHDMADQVSLMSFDHARITEARALRPEWKMGLLLTVSLGDALRLEADYYAVPTGMATRSFIRAAHRRGREVHVWVVDDPVVMSSMLSRGVDNLYTGSTPVARRVLAERLALGPFERLLIDVAAELGVVRTPPETPVAEEDA